MDARLIYWGVPAQPNKSGIGNIYLNALNLKSKELTHKHQHQDAWLPMPIPPAPAQSSRTMRKFPAWSPGALQRQDVGVGESIRMPPSLICWNYKKCRPVRLCQAEGSPWWNVEPSMANWGITSMPIDQHRTSEQRGLLLLQQVHLKGQSRNLTWTWDDSQWLLHISRGVAQPPKQYPIDTPNRWQPGWLKKWVKMSRSLEVGL